MVDGVEFIDIDRARHIVQQLYPDAHRIEFIEHGFDNIVALVDRDYAVRFPRNREAFIRSQYEKAILGKLGSIRSVQIPKLLDQNDDLPYLIMSYVGGRHMTPEEVAGFSDDDQKRFGVTVGRFAYELHSSISAADEQAFRLNAQLGDQFDQSWADYFQATVAGDAFTSDTQVEIAQTYYKKWREFYDSSQPQVVVHDDLNMNNMLFNDQQLIGILDFAEANIGVAEQELRQLYRVNDAVLDAAIHTYQELSGRQLNRDAIITWAIMQELGAYVRFRSTNPEHPGFIRAVLYLNRWLPEGSWGEVTSEPRN